MNHIFRSNGKLIITGEYFVLDGAEAFALPTKFGQTLEVEQIKNQNNLIFWKAINSQNQTWFNCIINYKENKVVETSNHDFSERLISIFNVLKSLNPLFFESKINDFNIKTKLEFPNNWGLGSSSTLINNLAKWTHTNPYEILEKTFGGSGYDLACAEHNYPIIFKKDGSLNNKITEIYFNPEFKNNILFIHLNKKQDSRQGIKLYKQTEKNQLIINQINEITNNIIKTNNIKDFEVYISKHEKLISNHLNIKTIKDALFNDFNLGTIKSLGAWGGDFIMIITENIKKSKEYFIKKGFFTIIDYEDMILN